MPSDSKLRRVPQAKTGEAGHGKCPSKQQASGDQQVGFVSKLAHRGLRALQSTTEAPPLVQLSLVGRLARDRLPEQCRNEVAAAPLRVDEVRSTEWVDADSAAAQRDRTEAQDSSSAKPRLGKGRG
ncbi:hypothetical protein G7Z17_g12580 [Cylindrodendrum hubeiense]|uniref:Uncharacterized protein n=1 Tax=Cylindrodendrum hubeiense TaxID=595255 RepID=A0A9P5H0M0_9HYPO|nr:hypothetical protein G7Z17_g12580 [Cylindrodendrum hubeiense]